MVTHISFLMKYLIQAFCPFLKKFQDALLCNIELLFIIFVIYMISDYSLLHHSIMLLYTIFKSLPFNSRMLDNLHLMYFFTWFNLNLPSSYLFSIFLLIYVSLYIYYLLPSPTLFCFTLD